MIADRTGRALMVRTTSVPTVVLKCPRCARLAAARGASPPEHFRFRDWSDGLCVMGAEGPRCDLARCLHCAALFREGPAAIGSFRHDDDLRRVADAWLAAPALPPPDARIYLDALGEGLAGELGGEAWLRALALWAANEPRRRRLPRLSPILPLPAEVALEQLAWFECRASPDEGEAWLARAEAARERGDFDAARRALDRRFYDDDALRAQWILDAVEFGTTAVMPLILDAGGWRYGAQPGLAARVRRRLQAWQRARGCKPRVRGREANPFFGDFSG